MQRTLPPPSRSIVGMAATSGLRIRGSKQRLLGIVQASMRRRGHHEATSMVARHLQHVAREVAQLRVIEQQQLAT